MAQEFLPVVPKRHPGLPLRTTNEARYWARYQLREDFELPGSVSHVEFSPTAPYDLAIVAGARVTIVDGKTNKVNRVIGSFKDVAYSGSFKHDGRLLCAGSADGVLQVFDVQKRATLRSLRGHSGAIRTSQFSMDGLRVLTGSDDKTVKLWDLPTGREMAELGGHEDYVRAQSRFKVSPHLWATGCYDHKLRLFDLRTQKAIFTLNHDYPVEAVLIPPGGGLAISAGGQEVRVFELFAGGRILQRLSNHAKAVTCLALDATETRLLTGGLDEQVKVHDLNTFEVGASIHFKGQLLSVGASPDKSRLAAGLASGKCTVKLIDKKSVAMGLDWAGESLADRRKSEETRLFREISRGQQKEHKRQPRPGSLRYFLRGKNEGPTAGDLVIGEKTRLKRKSYDMYLRKFMYGAALDEALTKKRIDVTAAAIEDLIQREGLRIALSNRSPERLIPVLQCLERNVSDPRYAELMLVVSNMVLDLYSKVVGRWVEVDTALARVHRAVQRETQAKNDLMCLVGMMELAIGTPAADPIQVLDNA